MRQLGARPGAKGDYSPAHRVVDRKDLGLPVHDDGNPAEAVLLENFQALRFRDLFQLGLGPTCSHATRSLGTRSLSIGPKTSPGDLIGPDADPVLAGSRRHRMDWPEAHPSGG